MSYVSKDEVVQSRQLKVQRVVIPFYITADATPADVVPLNDEPTRLFLQTEGVDQITDALNADETATYTSTPVDADGVFLLLLKVKEPLAKVVSAYCFNRVTGVRSPTFIDSATGITTGDGGGESIMLAVDSTTDLSSDDLDACLIVEYAVEES